MASRYLIDAKYRVQYLQALGLDISLRNNSGLWGLSNRDESRDISVLFSPKELVIYLAGFKDAWINRHRLQVAPAPIAECLPVADSQPPDLGNR